MHSRVVIQEQKRRTPDGSGVVYFDICDVLQVEGREGCTSRPLHKPSDVVFTTHEEAEAWVAQQP